MQFPWRWNGDTISLNLGLSGKCGIGELNKMIRLVSFSVALVLLFGCAGGPRDAGPLPPSAWCISSLPEFVWIGGSQFKAVPVDSKTSRFPTRFVISLEELAVSKEFLLKKYKQRLYVMVVDVGRREFIHRTRWEKLLYGSSKRKFVAGYDDHFLSIDESWRSLPGMGKPAIDAFFKRSFQEIRFFDQVIVIPQDTFEKIIRSEEDKRRAPDKERLSQFPLALAALQRRYEDGEIDNGEYVRKQRENENEQLITYAAINKPTVIFTDSTGLHDVQEYYGDHLIAHIVVGKTTRTSVRVDLRILDPVTRSIVFHAHNSMAGWGRKSSPPFDACVIYPLFNAFIDWVERNSDMLH